MRTSVRARVAHRERVTPQHVLLRLEAGAIAERAQPGQFVHLRVTEGCDPLLRRPFSVMRAEPTTGLIDLLVQEVGRGSELVAGTAEGQWLDLLGPLGRSFPQPPAGATVLLVAGGVGVAPLVFLGEAIAEAPPEYQVVGLFGARTEALLCCWLELSARCEEFTAVTEDGTIGVQGLVTEELERRLEVTRGPRVVYACGPMAMLAAVARVCADEETPAWVSLEQWMGCGVGACLGCVVPAKAPARERYVRVCKEGPVFAAEELDWEAMPR